MKTLVVYTSQTGFTKRYAEWLADAAGADCLELAQAKARDLSGYDAIIFGGWVCAGSISKIDWFKRNIDRWPGKKLAVFCVGGSPIDSPDIAPFLERNFTPVERTRLKAFYCPGGFNYEKMPAPSKLMMKRFYAALKAKKDKTEAEEAMAEMISKSYDISDKKHIEPILKYLNE